MDSEDIALACLLGTALSILIGLIIWGFHVANMEQHRQDADNRFHGRCDDRSGRVEITRRTRICIKDNTIVFTEKR